MNAPASATETLAAGRDMLAPGTTLAGRYRIEAIAGVGGMGVVYRAHDLQLGIDVALKLLHPDRADDAGAHARLHREVVLARRVSHPNVVRLHDVARDGALTFLTMDHIAAPTLRERLTGGPLPPSAAVAIGRQVVAALAAAHAQGVIHRDLKPANVLVADDGRAWLSDFGIARAAGDAAGLTTAGELVGTLDYLAPEQVRGDEVTAAADVYAFGLVLWEMLTGAVPLRGATRQETLAQRAAARPPVRLPGAEHVPRGLAQVVERCLAPDAAARYPDLAELGADLARGGRAARRARRLGWTAALALVVGLIGWAGSRPPAVPPAAAPATHRIAVLPFVNATADAANDWVQRALPDHVALTLSGSPHVETIDSVRVFGSLDDLRIAPTGVDARALREMFTLFNADAIVSGRLVGAGDGLRLQVSLLRRGGADERRYERRVTASGIVDGAEALAAGLLAELNVPRATRAPVAELSAEPAALIAFDDGVGRLARGDRTGAVTAFEAAVRADPAFGVAWLRLSDAYLDTGAYERGVDAAQRASALLEPVGGRHALWARARHMALAGDHDDALAVLHELTRRYPRDVHAQVAYAEALAHAGDFGAAIERLRTVVDADPQHPRAWYLLGKFAIQSGDPRRAAEDWLVRALVVQNRFGNDEGRAEVVNALGIANEHVGALDVAAAHYREAARLRGGAGDRRGESGSLANLARVTMIGGDLAAARTTLSTALALRERIGDLPGVADLRNEFGVLEEEVGDYATALAHYREALRLRTEVGDDRGATESRSNMAFAYLMLGEYDNADAFAQRALAEYDRTGDTDGRVMAQLTLAQLGIVRADWTAARGAVLDVLAGSRDADNPYAEAAAEGLLGDMSRQQGRFGPALAAYARALEIVTALGDTRGLVEFHLQRAALWLDMQAVDRAVADLAAAAEAGGGSAPQRAVAARLAGVIAARRGDAAAANAAFARAASLAQSAGSAPEALATRVARARWLPAPTATAAALAQDAAALGHRPLRLESLARVAALQHASGDGMAAARTAADALRPPVAVAQWAGNWRLHHAVGDVARARALYDAMWTGVPPELVVGFDDAVAN